MDALEAREVLIGLKLADFPNGKKEPRQKMFREFQRKAYPKELGTSHKPLTTRELAAKMQQGFR